MRDARLCQCFAPRWGGDGSSNSCNPCEEELRNRSAASKASTWCGILPIFPESPYPSRESDTFPHEGIKAIHRPLQIAIAKFVCRDGQQLAQRSNLGFPHFFLAAENDLLEPGQGSFCRECVKTRGTGRLPIEKHDVVDGASQGGRDLRHAGSIKFNRHLSSGAGSDALLLQLGEELDALLTETHRIGITDGQAIFPVTNQANGIVGKKRPSPEGASQRQR